MLSAVIAEGIWTNVSSLPKPQMSPYGVRRSCLRCPRVIERSLAERIDIKPS
jgi:hypothetical protein